MAERKPNTETLNDLEQKKECFKLEKTAANFRFKHTLKMLELDRQQLNLDEKKLVVAKEKLTTEQMMLQVKEKEMRLERNGCLTTAINLTSDAYPNSEYHNGMPFAPPADYIDATYMSI